MKIDVQNLPVVPGLTGFARFVTSSNSIAAPQGSVARVSGNKAIVFVVDGDEFQPAEITVGATSDGWTAITDGLSPGMTVIADGHQVLEPGDTIDYESLTTVSTN